MSKTFVIRVGGYYLQGENGWGPRADARVFKEKELGRYLKCLLRSYPAAVAESADAQTSLLG